MVGLSKPIQQSFFPKKHGLPSSYANRYIVEKNPSDIGVPILQEAPAPNKYKINILSSIL